MEICDSLCIYMTQKTLMKKERKTERKNTSPIDLTRIFDFPFPSFCLWNSWNCILFPLPPENKTKRKHTKFQAIMPSRHLSTAGCVSFERSWNRWDASLRTEITKPCTKLCDECVKKWKTQFICYQRGIFICSLILDIPMPTNSLKNQQ